MPIWIPVTLAAAFAQNLRFMLQRHLAATQLTPAGATFARFVFSAPLAILIILTYAAASDQPLPRPGAEFFAFGVTGALAQIGATIAVVALFSARQFAVGIAFKKTETVQAAILGLLVLGDTVTPAAFVAILIGLGGVLALSKPPEGQISFANRATALGLLCGLLFAVSGVGYRGASLSLSEGDTVLRALVTLSAVTTFQTCIMAAGLAIGQRGEITRTLRAWRVTALVGLTSLIGSALWFIAFALQTVAYVKALGQVELVFSLLASTLIYKEKISTREGAGMALITASVLLLIWSV
ncbi:DMT family transporter [Aestuariibius insulae]|uniref:DMT family transporter n=1 Tax=Aestuariibius insulae TaxID=2058287 RepID=UPI00345E41F5